MGVSVATLHRDDTVDFVLVTRVQSFMVDVTSAVSERRRTTSPSVGGGGSALSTGLLAVPAAVLAGSAMTCAAIALDRRLHQMSYYFFVSLAVQHALMSITVMLPGVHVLQTGM